MPSSLWGLTCMSWKITSTISSLSLLHIKSLRSPSARTMSCSFPSQEVRMQKKGRSTSPITCHPLSPLKKVRNQSFALSFGPCVFACLFCILKQSELCCPRAVAQEGPAGCYTSVVFHNREQCCGKVVFHSFAFLQE